MALMLEGNGGHEGQGRKGWRNEAAHRGVLFRLVPVGRQAQLHAGAALHVLVGRQRRPLLRAPGPYPQKLF